jgi:undecaprenyl-diphosphatase
MPQLNEQVQEKAKKFSISLLVMLAVFIGLVYLFWQITDEVVIEKEGRIDAEIHQQLLKFRHPIFTRIMLFFTFFGSRSFLLPAYILLVSYYLFYLKKMASAIAIAIVALSGGVVLPLLKNIFKRNRPLQPLVEDITSFSYPSGHSFSAFNLCGILVYLIWITNIKRSVKWISTICLFVFASTICFSRVYLHVHYASDVIAGFCLSLIWLALCYFILMRLNVIKKMRD